MANRKNASNVEAPGLVVTGAVATVNGVQVATETTGGITGSAARRYGFSPGDSAGTRRWVRLMSINGGSSLGGAYANFLLSGVGDYGDVDRGTLLIHFSQRGDNITQVKAWGWNVENTQDVIELYTVQVSTWVFELWIKVADFNQEHEIVMLGRRNASILLDNIGTVAPTSPVLVTGVEKMDGPAHLAGAETFTGAKTFSAGLVATTADKLATDLIASYPPGISYHSATTANGWPCTFGTAMTVNLNTARCFQIVMHKFDGRMWFRTYIDNAWSSFTELANTRREEVIQYLDALTVRENLVVNPSFETGIGTALASTNSSVSRTSAFSGGVATGLAGTQALAITCTTAAAFRGRVLSGLAVVPGATYAVSVYVRSQRSDNPVTRDVLLTVDWTTGNTFVSTVSSATTPVASSGTSVAPFWTRVSMVVTAPSSGIDSMMIFVGSQTTPGLVGEVLLVDGVMVERSATVAPYFDGAMSAASWSGTAHASASILDFGVADADATSVHLAGVETVTGVKTFSAGLVAQYADLKIANGKLASAAPSTYPFGMSTASVLSGANGWPDNGIVTTIIQEATRNFATQLLIGKTTTGMWMRSSADNATWTAFVQLSTGGAGVSQTVLDDNQVLNFMGVF